MKSPLEILQAILSDPTNPDVVNTLVAHDATFVSLSYYDPELQKIMPWASTGTGPSSIITAFLGVRRFWTNESFDIRETLESEDKAAIFGSLTLRSTTLGKVATSPFAILAKVRDGQVIFMQFLENTFATTGTFRTGGKATFHSNPDGPEVTL